uniref:Uncharacterized protein n=1 Tax=Aegilops tauschii subsp. strangulata TaxID=200361 RepID=A0A453D470_AEGTS
ADPTRPLSLACYYSVVNCFRSPDFIHGMLKVFLICQVAATTKKTPNSRIPKYPSLPSQLLCQVQTSPCMYVHTVHLQVQV